MSVWDGWGMWSMNFLVICGVGVALWAGIKVLGLMGAVVYRLTEGHWEGKP